MDEDMEEVDDLNDITEVNLHHLMKQWGPLKLPTLAILAEASYIQDLDDVFLQWGMRYICSRLSNPDTGIIASYPLTELTTSEFSVNIFSKQLSTRMMFCSKTVEDSVYWIR